MRSVMFTFEPDVAPDVQDGILANIGNWDAIFKATRLYPDAKSAEVLRMCCVYVHDDSLIHETMKRLSEVPEIESAFEPEERRLVR